MAAEDMREIERKYDVDESTTIPDLRSLAGVARVDPPEVNELEAVYFDTETLALAGEHITLRRRTGGDDAGWHLKLPIAADERSELHEPLESDPQRIPDRFRRLVAVHVRGHALLPVVRLRNHRIVVRLRADDDRILALFCDDVVNSERLGPDPLPQSWREWEVELVDATGSFLAGADRMFRTVDVWPSTSSSKLARALGGRAPQRTAPMTTPGSAGDLLMAALRQYRARLVSQDPLVRDEQPEAVHRMRIAIATLRSAFVTFGGLLSGQSILALRSDLGWLAAILGTSRDLHMLSARLDALLRAEPPDMVVGPIANTIRAQLAAESAAEQSAMLQALDSERYFRLLDALDDLIASPTLTEDASAPAKAVLPGMIDRRIAKLRRAMRAAKRTTAGDPHERALHDVRKAAKKVRYSEELFLPNAPKRAKRLAAAAKSLQEVLGEHHDSIVAQSTLLRLSGMAHNLGENTFSYGRLHAREQARSKRAEARYDRLLRRSPKRLTGR